MSDQLQEVVDELMDEAAMIARGINLDIGCGYLKKDGWVGMDARKFPCVDIVRDPQNIPWPLPNDCCNQIGCANILEKLDPTNFGVFRFMNECWRVLKPGRFLYIVTAYPGSKGFNADPRNVRAYNELFPTYFVPDHPYGTYDLYHPLPWAIKANAWHTNGNIEFQMVKLNDPDLLENVWELTK